MKQLVEKSASNLATSNRIARYQGECTTVRCARFTREGERTVPDVSLEYQNGGTDQDHPIPASTEGRIAARRSNQDSLTSKPHRRCSWCSACTGPRCSSTSPGCCSTWSPGAPRSTSWTTPFGERPVGRGCRRRRSPRCRGSPVAMTPTRVENSAPGRPTTWRKSPRRCRFRAFHLLQSINHLHWIRSSSFFFSFCSWKNGKWREFGKMYFRKCVEKWHLKWN